MNNFEKKAFRFDILSSVYENLQGRQTYYMDAVRDEDGNHIEDDDGRWVYKEPSDGYNKERLAVLRELIADFEKWALK